MNVGKTKVMVTSKSSENPRAEIYVGDLALEQVSSFKYLGSVLSEDCRCIEEIKSRIENAKSAFNQMRKTF